jgi:glutamate dehydrogenase (NADP+)
MIDQEDENMSYVDEVLEMAAQRDPNEPEFLQAVKEAFEAIRPVVDANEKVYRENAILERFVEPERIYTFPVTWEDDAHKVHVNRAWRIQFNSAIGSYKGGTRFHKTVNLSILKFLGFEMVLKNSLTGLPLGGGKGGSDFDPHGKSDREVMRFCQAYMNALYRYIGPEMDCPSGDIGVGGREIGYLFGQYKKLTSSFDAALCGKGVNFGGSLGRTEATGYGLAYMTDEMCKACGKELTGRTTVVTGSGSVAIYAAQKIQQLGAKVVAMCDSNGYIYDEKGIDIEVIRQIKETERARISEYAARVPGAVYTPGKGIWNIKCEIFLPCATQNEISLDAAKTLVGNGCFLLAEGANMPLEPEAVRYLQDSGILYMPGKAASAGGVSVSGFEQAQNAQRMYWTFEEVDAKLQRQMAFIFNNVAGAAKRYGKEGNYLAGANICAFERVAQAMVAQGLY